MSAIKKAVLPLATLAAGVALYVGACGDEPAEQSINSDPGPNLKELSASLTTRPFDWQVVVNTDDVMPNSELTFNSFNPPAVNRSGRVVFRARSRGSEDGRARGIYALGAQRNAALEVIADATTAVPQPNNTGKSFTEFPSVPRIDAASDLSSTRGQHAPIWRYDLAEGEETRVGTTGIYTNTRSGPRARVLETAASLVGVAPGFARFAVPDSDPALKFDVFPGSPSPTTFQGQEIVTFKGNYTQGAVRKTGVFFRTLTPDAAVQLIANTETPLPNPPAAEPNATFGSTATPSADGDKLVFTGYIEEAIPERGGGIYLAPIASKPELRTLVGIGDPVPGVDGATFRAFGEALSFTGRSVAFWAAWGDATRELFLPCPTEGNRDRRDYCNATLPPRDPACTENCEHGLLASVPVNQGIFVYDLPTGKTELIASTGEQIADFLYWNYSGHVPEPGGEPDAEEPRWRSSAFFAHSELAGAVAFRARQATYDPASQSYAEITDALYLDHVADTGAPQAVLTTGAPAAAVDAEAPEGAVVTELGLERDGFRGRWLAITAKMEVPGGEEDAGIAGIYRTMAAAPSSAPKGK